MLAPRSWSLVLAGAMALGFAPGVARGQAAPEPCHEDTRYGALVDWVGEWRVLDESGSTVASSYVRRILAGCAFEEVRRRADGVEEMGLIFLDPASDTWQQRWLSSLGQTGLFTLAIDEAAVSAQGVVADVDGEQTLIRALIAPRAEGGFEQTLEISTDGGQVYSAAGSTLYLPPVVVPVAPSAAPSEPEPVTTPAEPIPAVAPPAPAEPAPSTSVRVRSKRKAQAPIPETAMESPMTLEFELGPLTDLPPGAAWRTAELAPYVADQVNIPTVTAQSRKRRGRTELELVVNLRTRVGQSKVDLDVTLLDGDASVAGAQQQGIALGKLIRAHDPKAGLAQTVRIAIDADTFAALFADGKRPSVRLTVTVR